jgi:hypothetical protein
MSGVGVWKVDSVWLNLSKTGGVAFYIRNDVTADTEKGLHYSNGVNEILGLYVKAKNLLLFNVYRQPDDIDGGHRSTSKEFKQVLDKFNHTLSTFHTPTPDILLCGDFNLPHVLWPDGSAKPGATRDEQVMIKALMDIAQDLYLTQQVARPTHRGGNILDLLFSNNPEYLHSYRCVETIFSDHYIVECTTIYKPDSTYNAKSQPESTIGTGADYDLLNFFSDDTDWKGLENELSNHNWAVEFHSAAPNDMLSKFVRVCYDISKDYVPCKKRCEAGNKSKIPRERRNLMRRRCRINRQLHKAITDARRQKLREEAKDIEKKLKRSYDNDRATNEHKAVSAIKKNIKYFFSYAKKFSKLKCGIGPLVDADKNTVTCAREMADMLAHQYESVFSKPKQAMEDPNDMFSDECSLGRHLHDIYFDVDDIVEAIGEISSISAAGPDRFPAILLTKCSRSLSKPLYMIWRLSLDQGVIPSLLKTANIVPIHKGGSRGIPKNYRPVALTSHLVKIFEKVVRKHIVAYLQENNLLNPGQHGFRSGRSCLSQLITHFDNILRILEDNDNVDVVYLDFAKAFDKVDFLVTLRKLKNLGISGKLGKWLYAFLTDRTQAVLVNGARSKHCEVKSGVPQGSVLGPLLFLILIGDIDDRVTTSFVSSFADDTRVGRRISTESDVKDLQADLNTIYQWAVDNNMQFNSDKFECLRYGKNKDIQTHTHYTSNSADAITVKESVKDLGVTMSSDGSFKKQIANVIESANKMCGWILRTFRTRAAHPMLTLWRSMVLSRLDYCSQLWCPIQKGDIQALEGVQRSFIRKISGVNHLNYWEQLHELGLYSLERRRERYQIIYTWRILEDQVPNIHAPNKGAIQADHHIRRGRFCQVPHVSKSAPPQVQKQRYASFSLRGPCLFNSLPHSIRNKSNCSTDEFKRNLDKYLATVPDEPQVPGYTAFRRAESNSLLHMAQIAAPQTSMWEVEDYVTKSTIRGGQPWSPWE